ncbi:MAG: NTP transferase domain-containing protein [Cyclobacteriaceae bacterium]|nr:NTP transferase domain-containing protein [Cyclobacteriaceae bacterium HetDA_MAG_MS6]
MKINSCVILVAGRNSRLDTGIPKSLLTLDGIPILERHIKLFSQNGISRFCLVTGYQAERIEHKAAELQSKYPDISIETVHNSDFHLENGLSVCKAESWAATHGIDRFLLTMGDHVFQPDFVTEFIRKASKKSKKCLYLAVDKPGSTNAHIDIEDVTKVLVKEGKKRILQIGKALSTYNFYDTGLFSLSAEIFTEFRKSFDKNEYTISDTVNRLVANKQASTIEVSGYLWNDVDNPSDYQTTTDLTQELLQ